MRMRHDERYKEQVFSRVSRPCGADGGGAPGGQRLAMNYTQRLAGANLVPSVGSVHDSYDNALA